MTDLIKCAYSKCNNMFVPNTQAGKEYCCPTCAMKKWRRDPANKARLQGYAQKHYQRHKERKKQRRRSYGQKSKQVYAPRPQKTPFAPILFQHIDSPDKMAKVVHDMFVDINVKAMLKRACEVSVLLEKAREAGRRFRKGR